MKAARLLISLVAGFALGLLTWLVFGGHVGGGPPFLGELIAIVCLPGLFTEIAVTRNIHGGSLGTAVLGNVLFYFALTYLILAIRDKRAKARASRAADSATSRS